MARSIEDSRLLHYSAAPLSGALRSTVTSLSVNMKPKGLWVSVGGAWAEWCLGENFALRDLGCTSEIVLKPRAKILRLASASDIDRVTSDFGAPLYPGARDGLALDWPAIAQKHDGIIIAPYQWARRLDDRTSWYYGWDCASGCIWRPRAIADIRPLAEPVAEAA